MHRASLQTSISLWTDRDIPDIKYISHPECCLFSTTLIKIELSQLASIFVSCTLHPFINVFIFGGGVLLWLLFVAFPTFCFNERSKNNNNPAKWVHGKHKMRLTDVAERLCWKQTAQNASLRITAWIKKQLKMGLWLIKVRVCFLCRFVLFHPPSLRLENSNALRGCRWWPQARRPSWGPRERAWRWAAGTRPAPSTPVNST